MKQYLSNLFIILLKKINLKPGKRQNKQKDRIEYIDFLRASAVVLMIFAHILDATLSPEYKRDDLYRLMNFINGFVAPAFLFAAGASFTIIITKRKNDIINFQKPFFKQLWRVIQLLAIGYFLHLPYKTLNQMNTIITRDEYINFIRSDILHVIALGLFISLLVLTIFREEKRFYLMIFIISLLTISLTPLVRSITFSDNIPIEVATFLNKQYKSIFPLFPWLAYLFIGSIVMYYILKYSKEGAIESIFKKLFFLCIILIFLSALPEIIGIQTNDKYNFWHTSVNIVCIKLCVVLLYMLLMWKLENKYNYKMKIIKIFGKESLFVYVFHLIIVYGSIYSIGLNKSIGRNLDRLEMFLVFFGVMIVSLIATYVWYYVKNTSLLLTRILLFFFVGYFAYYFLTKPF
mgnify:CR=1 FL=1